MKPKYLLWLPALFAVMAYCFFYQPPDWGVGWRQGRFALQLSVPGLIGLLGVGLLLSLWCQRAGGNHRDQLAAALFFPVFAATFGITMSMDSVLTFQGAMAPSLIAGWLLSYMLIPALPLLAGWWISIGLTRASRSVPATQGPEGPSKSLACRVGDEALGHALGLRLPWFLIMIALPIFQWSNSLNDRWVHGQAMRSVLWKIGMLRVGFSIAQLVALVLLGWVLVHAARRLGGKRRAQVFIALSPAGWWLGMILMAISSPMWLIDRPGPIPLRWAVSWILSQAAIPGAELLAGALIAIRMGSSKLQGGQQVVAEPGEFPSQPGGSRPGNSVRGHLRGWLRWFGPSHA